MARLAAAGMAATGTRTSEPAATGGVTCTLVIQFLPSGMKSLYRALALWTSGVRTTWQSGQCEGSVGKGSYIKRERVVRSNRGG